MVCEDEIWLDSIETEDQGYGPCTCDDDYNSNVYSYACYDIKTTHAVECAASKDQCPEGWYQMGDRYNNNHDADARTKYCAVHNGTCAEGEVFYNPHSSSMQA